MANLQKFGLNSKLKKIEREKIPTLEEIREENEDLKEKEGKFEKRFGLKTKKHAKRK